MNPASDHDEKLERLIGETLHRQPPRRAPATLELRVLDEIERRARASWWRMSFARWPMAAQALFLLASAAMAKVAIDVSVWAMNGLGSAAVVTGVASVAVSM